MAGVERTNLHTGGSVSYVSAHVRLGAVRYRCPESGSYVLLTDPAALKHVSTRPMPCAGCGGVHRLRCTEVTRVDSAA
jgi:hypothetical protein